VAVTNFGSVAIISAGEGYSLAVKADGSVYAWGLNANGQFGDGTTTSSSTPVAIAGLSSIDAIAGGASHTIHLSTDDTVWAAGRNQSAQLGDGTLVTRHSPVEVSEAGFVWKVGTPTFSVQAGTYTSVQSVTVASVTPGATVRYTTNGGDPTESDAEVPANGIVSVAQSLTLKARAWKSGIPESNVDGTIYTLRVASPSLSPGGATYNVEKTITVTDSVSGVTMR
jgi:alpha-tubulin suppressor-like RCC1 family protein